MLRILSQREAMMGSSFEAQSRRTEAKSYDKDNVKIVKKRLEKECSLFFEFLD